MNDFQNQKDSLTVAKTYIPMTSIASNLLQAFTTDISFLTVQIVNVIFVKTKHSFVLIDAGMPQSENIILRTVEATFGTGVQPEAIILTHAHFDHVGALERLLKQWNVPVYAHPEELPYLTGEKNYPEPDGSVEGGLIAKISPLFPNQGINIAKAVHPLPKDGTVPYLDDWQWIHTPGHTDGHISLFRERTRTLIAGDAFVTVRQDKFLNVLIQKQEVSGPPRYFTTDWQEAKNSVSKLAALSPLEAITGHGLPLKGDKLKSGLQYLLENFDLVAIPDRGKYV